MGSLGDLVSSVMPEDQMEDIPCETSEYRIKSYKLIRQEMGLRADHDTDSAPTSSPEDKVSSNVMETGDRDPDLNSDG
jgi:hypothetical protein